MHTPKLFLALSAVLFAGMRVSAQGIGPATPDAAGASITSGGITYEYSIGEPIATDIQSSPALLITHGVLQPAASTAFVSHPIPTAELKVYPDPMETQLFIQPRFAHGGSLQFRLYDAAGKLIAGDELRLATGNERQTIDVARFAAGHYMLQVVWQSAGAAQAAAFKLEKLR